MTPTEMAYYNHLCSTALGRLSRRYTKLTKLLHSIPFRYSVLLDENRISDVMDMRIEFDSFALFPEEVSVLEVMVALAQRCFYSILDDGTGDRVPEIFQLMLNNLDLLGCTDDNFHELYARQNIDTFLDRKYSRDGKGGLFYIPNAEQDMREADLWYQAMWYIDTIIN